MSDANERRLVTPIHLKSSTELDWPEGEKAFYVLAGDGLYMCREHEFYRSCTKARSFPAELCDQEEFLEPGYPKISQRQFELIVGFFWRVAELHASEAGCLLAWDRDSKRVRIIVPDQEATVGVLNSGYVYPIGLHYQVPDTLPSELMIFGDVHSHVEGQAYSSSIDQHDEMHLPGLHIVVGRISQEPPEIHVEAVVDGSRFKLEPEEVIEGYRRRTQDVPRAWMDRVSVTINPYRDHWSSDSYTAGASWSSCDDSRVGTNGKDVNADVAGITDDRYRDGMEGGRP